MTKEEREKKAEELKSARPTEPGRYWARKGVGYGWYNWLVTLSGEAPLLYVSEIVDFGEGKFFKSIDDPARIVWGPKFEEPQVPKEEVVKNI